MTTAINTIAWIPLILLGFSKVTGQLNSTFYDSTCPNVSSTVQAAVQQATYNETNINLSACLISLSGVHTIGQVRCSSFRMHIYNGTNIKSTFASSVQANCPFTVGDNNLSPLDLQTPTTFDSDCFMNLMSRQGLLHSGQEPFNGGSADSQVTTYASNQNTFFTDFAAAMVIMGNIIPLTGNDPIPNSKDCANCGGHGKDPRPCCAPHFNVSLEQFDGSSSPSNGQLSSTFYDKTCPKALSIVKAAVKQAVAKEKRMGASLLRLHFHDCFVNGCDGSILLDDSSSITGEKTARPNANSVRGFDVIDNIKTQVEAACSGIVSCADISAIAARDSVVELGGPSWTVQLGRRDSRTVSLSGANSQIPAPTSSLNTLISSFCNQGLSTKDMIALSGAHTIGQVRCTSFRSHIYNETNINSAFANSVKAKCPSNGGDNNLSPLDVQTPTVFDNKYYVNLKNQKGLLHSDHELFNGGYADSQVTTYSNNQNTFFSDFVAAMVNMGNLSPLTGTNGEVRKNCRKPN